MPLVPTSPASTVTPSVQPRRVRLVDDRAQLVVPAGYTAELIAAGPGPVFLGGDDVTADSGWQLPPGEVHHLEATADLWACTRLAHTADVRARLDT